MNDHYTAARHPFWARPPKWLAAAAVTALVANTFVVAVVNYYIYWARARFIATHPDYVAQYPPTISRALSDPLIGEPFAFWISLSAGILFMGVCVVAGLSLLAARHLKDVSPATARTMAAAACTAIVLQIGASAGMVVLSQYRMGVDNDMHMVGSYLFFFSQGFVVLSGLLISTSILRNEEVHPVLHATALVHLPAARMRRTVGKISAVLALSYLVLFVVKDITLPLGNAAVYQAYVWTEPAVISSFLLFVSIFHLDLVMVLRRYRDAARAAPDATAAPADASLLRR